MLQAAPLFSFQQSYFFKSFPMYYWVNKNTNVLPGITFACMRDVTDDSVFQCLRLQVVAHTVSRFASHSGSKKMHPLSPVFWNAAYFTFLTFLKVSSLSSIANCCLMRQRVVPRTTRYTDEKLPNHGKKSEDRCSHFLKNWWNSLLPFLNERLYYSATDICYF